MVGVDGRDRYSGSAYLASGSAAVLEAPVAPPVRPTSVTRTNLRLVPSPVEKATPQVESPFGPVTEEECRVFDGFVQSSKSAAVDDPLSAAVDDYLSLRGFSPILQTPENYRRMYNAVLERFGRSVDFPPEWVSNFPYWALAPNQSRDVARLQTDAVAAKQHILAVAAKERDRLRRMADLEQKIAANRGDTRQYYSVEDY